MRSVFPEPVRCISMVRLANQWVKSAPFGRWDLRYATAPYPER